MANISQKQEASDACRQFCLTMLVLVYLLVIEVSLHVLHGNVEGSPNLQATIEIDGTMAVIFLALAVMCMQ